MKCEIVIDKHLRKNTPGRRPEKNLFEKIWKGDEQEIKDDTNHEDEETVEEPDVRYPSSTRKPPKHLKDHVVGDDVETVDTNILHT